MIHSNRSIFNGISMPELIKDETLKSMFESTAKKFPTKTALHFLDKTLTYTELDSLANNIALQLKAQQIERGNRVCILMPRGYLLHASILAVVKIGACYVPMDYDFPDDRVQAIIDESEAILCITDKLISIDIKVFDPSKIKLEEVEDNFEGPLVSDDAYILYTSGSTGKPKGIPITHGQICHLIRSEQFILQISHSDRVYQGFSVSFDMWCEETWIAYFVGAELFISDSILSKSFDDLSEMLREWKITVLHAVPTLLSYLDTNIPTLRIVNAGGEACSEGIKNKWAKLPIRFFNSYGPTETTVSATFAEQKSDDIIHIGKPLPNYNLAIVNEKLEAVLMGEKGELVISGYGVSNGYLNRPELTKEKFLEKPSELSELLGNRIYKSGDLASMNDQGQIIIHGRIDDQVKIRGYRIELGDIEEHMLQFNGLKNAAVTMYQDDANQVLLIGYFEKDKEHSTISVIDLTNFLKTQIPSYMVPDYIFEIEKFPQLASGKINRKALSPPETFKNNFANETALNPSAGNLEKIEFAIKNVFKIGSINPNQDFFTDYGGHSLLAANLVSQLRSQDILSSASIKDIYQHRPLGKLIEFWESKLETQDSQPKEKEKIFTKVSQTKFVLAGIIQLLLLVLIFGLFSAQFYIPYLGYYFVQIEFEQHDLALVTAFAMFFIVPPLITMITILLKWVVVGKFKEGKYELWGNYYLRWWFVKRLNSIVATNLLNGTTLYSAFLRKLGVQIPNSSILSNIYIGAEDLLEIGENVSVSAHVVFNNAVVENGQLILSKIIIHDNVNIGSASVVAGNTIIYENSELQDLSFLNEGQTIPPNSIFGGSPATFIRSKTKDEIIEKVPKRLKFKYNIIFMMLLVLIPFFILIPLWPIIYLLNEFDNAAGDYEFYYLVFSPAMGLIYICIYITEIVLIGRWLQKSIKPGNYSLYSVTYLKKWLYDQIMDLSLGIIHPLFATLYAPYLYKALRAKIGKNTEISTASNVSHHLLEIGEGAFIADAVILGEAEFKNNILTVGKTKIGNQTFIGNSALIPQGYEIGNNVLIGVLSIPPENQDISKDSGKDWFGSPAIELPKRQESEKFEIGLTWNPSKMRKFMRALIEFVRITIPQSIVLALSSLFIAFSHDLVFEETALLSVIKFPLYYLFFIGFPAFFFTVFLKWVLVGKYKAQSHPLWSLPVWLSEMVTSIYEALAIPFFLEYFKGTPFLPFFMKFYGVKMGKRVYLDTADFTEFDLVSIGNYSALNFESGPQTHLFEDRVMKMGPIIIGDFCNVGARSIVLYNTEINDKVDIKSLSLVMKGETLSEGSSWIGSPIISYSPKIHKYNSNEPRIN
jgi:non-ribosomal peptide synthetase-like protein